MVYFVEIFFLNLKKFIRFRYIFENIFLLTIKRWFEINLVILLSWIRIWIRIRIRIHQFLWIRICIWSKRIHIFVHYDTYQHLLTTLMSEAFLSITLSVTLISLPPGRSSMDTVWPKFSSSIYKRKRTWVPDSKTMIPSCWP